MSLFVIFKSPAVPSPYVPTSQETEPGRQMPELAGGHYRGHCRGDIAGAQDKVSERRGPGAALQCIPECISGLPLVVLKLYPELHSGIPPGEGNE
ncbi:unnamed protein product, partial [Staurois parvus]